LEQNFVRETKIRPLWEIIQRLENFTFLIRNVRKVLSFQKLNNEKQKDAL